MITSAILTAIQIYTVAILIWVVASWIPDMRRNKLVQQIGRVTEPYLGLFRRLVPTSAGIDFSPILAILALQLAARLFLRL